MHVIFNPKDTNTFASASLDRSIKVILAMQILTVQVWQLGATVPNFTLAGHEKGVNCIDYFQVCLIFTFLLSYPSNLHLGSHLTTGGRQAIPDQWCGRPAYQGVGLPEQVVRADSRRPHPQRYHRRLPSRAAPHPLRLRRWCAFNL